MSCSAKQWDVSGLAGGEILIKQGVLLFIGPAA